MPILVKRAGSEFLKPESFAQSSSSGQWGRLAATYIADLWGILMYFLVEMYGNGDNLDSYLRTLDSSVSDMLDLCIQSLDMVSEAATGRIMECMHAFMFFKPSEHQRANCIIQGELLSILMITILHRPQNFSE